jgi:hypothetical protein
MKKVWILGLPAMLVSLAVSSCSVIGMQPKDIGTSLPDENVKTASSVLYVLPVAQHLTNAMASGSRALSASGRAFIYAPQVRIRIYHPMDQVTPYREFLETTTLEGPGHVQAIPLTLPVGTGWKITVDIFNDAQPEGMENTVRGEVFGVEIVYGGENRIVVTCFPVYSPNLPEEGLVEESRNVSVYDPSLGEGGTFTTIGGEIWMSFQPSGSVLSLSFAPVGNDSVVYATIFNDQGKYLYSGLSPSFTDPEAGSSVQLDMGLTPGSTYYLCAIPIVLPESVTTADAVTIQNLGGADLTDDDYEQYLSNDNDAVDTAFPLGTILYSGYLVGNATARDTDWYTFTSYADDDQNGNLLYIAFEGITEFINNDEETDYEPKPEFIMIEYHDSEGTWFSSVPFFHSYDADSSTLVWAAPLVPGCEHRLGIMMKSADPQLRFNRPPAVPYSMTFGTIFDTEGSLIVE